MPFSPSPNLPPIPPLYTQKKSTILSALATPSDTYADLSPKGSVDSGIKSLIDQINTLDGIVTTSSCAGRISVFLEGAKTKAGGAGQAAVPGGKGMGGRWLFVSHDAVEMPVRVDSEDRPATRLIGLEPQQHDAQSVLGPEARFVKFQFEPMILHIMAASLHHAQPILTAAINAGFRESGVQSLKNLEDPNAFPMVAVRTAGLALGSIIGYAWGSETGEKETGALVSEEYLETLLRVANARFAANAERIERFSDSLFHGNEGSEPAWENPRSRRERKRAEGLKKKDQLGAQDSQLNRDHGSRELDDGPLLAILNTEDVT